ncbi:hypothetical protein SYNPS1DRAFT_19536, partial [Syncephalis pseudoplumigaleata]
MAYPPFYVVQAKGGTPPTDLYGHTAVLWHDYIVVFGGWHIDGYWPAYLLAYHYRLGGCDNEEFCNKVILFNLKDHTWHRPAVRGHQVIARYLHTAVVYNDKMYIYGGFARNPESTYVLAQMIALDLETFTWEKPCLVPPRYNHSALLIGDRMFIYAGKNGSGKTVTDLYALDLRLNKLLPQTGITGDIEPLKSYQFTEYIGDNRILIFGKFLKPSQEVEHSTWLLDIDTLVCRKLPNERYLDSGSWSYFTTVTTEELGETAAGIGDPRQRRLVFLGNADAERPEVYDHFRDLLVVDIEPTGVWQIPRVTMELDFSQLLESSELTDFTLKPADGEPIGVHRAVLHARWPHFRMMYTSGMKEATCDGIDFPEPHSVVMAFSRFLYTDQLDEDAPVDVVLGVLSMASLYLLPRLTKLCCRRLAEKHLTTSTAAKIFQAAITANECGLKLVALEYIFRNFGRV